MFAQKNVIIFSFGNRIVLDLFKNLYIIYICILDLFEKFKIIFVFFQFRNSLRKRF